MSRTLAIVPLVLLAFAATSLAQESQDMDNLFGQPAVTPAPASVPPMVVPWDSPREHSSYDGPRRAVHRAAALKAAQRRQRIAARNWMGYSPLRPPASPVPMMGGQSRLMIFRPPLRMPTVIMLPSTHPSIIVGASEAPLSR